ncbi:MAG: 3-dehydroquinate synthase [Prevotella sp.]|nr:3-dehydroquinate synthase [Prevotella sp.]
MEQKIIISKCLKDEISTAIEECEHDRVFILVDETTEKDCLPIVLDLNIPYLNEAKVITIGASDNHKDLDSLSHVWKSLCDNGATRHSCLLNIGGGMVTDLGGFAASTFKRGINFINIPTTLLAMVDASVGGKTGINFNGLKNEIGVFNDAKTVIINTEFLKSLDRDNICSGYAEMIKHGLISNVEMWKELMVFDILNPDLSQLQDMVARSINVKEKVVEQDPHEKGIRKALNLGHTMGHAFESMSLHTDHPLLHGYAVAFGIVCELYLSCVKTNFPTDIMRQTISYIKNTYGSFLFTCDDYDTLISLMKHDKKNTAGTINFTLLSGIGEIKINQTASKEELMEALDFLREGAN